MSHCDAHCILHSITHISVVVFIYFYFFIKAKCHHALLDRECKSINTYYLLVFHPFSVKSQLIIESILLSSEVVISSPLDSWPLQTQYHIYVSTCVGLELSVPWSKLFLGFKEGVLLIYYIRKTSNDVTRISQVEFQLVSWLTWPLSESCESEPQVVHMN